MYVTQFVMLCVMHVCHTVCHVVGHACMPHSLSCCGMCDMIVGVGGAGRWLACINDDSEGYHISLAE